VVDVSYLVYNPNHQVRFNSVKGIVMIDSLVESIKRHSKTSILAKDIDQLHPPTSAL